MNWSEPFVRPQHNDRSRCSDRECPAEGSLRVGNCQFTLRT
jgi:hypothetical protein